MKTLIYDSKSEVFPRGRSLERFKETVPDIRKVQSQYAITQDDWLILAHAYVSGFDVILPDAETSDLKEFMVKKIDSSANIVTLNGIRGQTIDGATTLSLSVQHEGCRIVAFDGNWYVVGVV